MVYPIIKLPIRLALKIFCAEIRINSPKLLEMEGPVLITANHPNSFFDAILIGARFRRPVHFLARGDAFRKPWHGKLLRMLNMIPVYRLSEGKENLGRNEAAFSKSSEILQNGGIVLIFIEGICVNQHKLQPFKKGAARIAFENRKRCDFKILPVSIAYDSFSRFGKHINFNIGKPITASSFLQEEDEAKGIRYFNEVLFEQIQKNIRIPSAATRVSAVKKGLLFLPAAVGYVLHIGFFLLIKMFVKKKTGGTVFYDSVLFGVLLFLYPVFLLLLSLFLFLFGVPLSLSFVVFIAAPFLAWCTVVGRRK